MWINTTTQLTFYSLIMFLCSLIQKYSCCQIFLVIFSKTFRYTWKLVELIFLKIVRSITFIRFFFRICKGNRFLILWPKLLTRIWRSNKFWLFYYVTISPTAKIYRSKVGKLDDFYLLMTLTFQIPSYFLREIKFC